MKFDENKISHQEILMSDKEFLDYNIDPFRFFLDEIKRISESKFKLIVIKNRTLGYHSFFLPGLINKKLSQNNRILVVAHPMMITQIKKDLGLEVSSKPYDSPGITITTYHKFAKNQEDFSGKYDFTIFDENNYRASRVIAPKIMEYVKNNENIISSSYL